MAEQSPCRRSRRGPGRGFRYLFRAFWILVTVQLVLPFVVLWQHTASLPYHPHPQENTIRRGMQQQQVAEEDRVAIMPQPQFEAIRDDDEDNRTIRVASAVSGCEPKFLVDSNNQSFLFKPSNLHGGALNEWIAYGLSEFLGLHRVPPVQAVALPDTDLFQAIVTHQNEQQQVSGYGRNPLQCQMELNHSQRYWIRHKREQSRLGTLQLLIPHVYQRAELDRAVEQHVLGQDVLERFRPVSAFVQRERDTRSLLFDALLGNKDRFNNDFVVHVSHPTKGAGGGGNTDMRLLLYLDNNLLSRHQPIPTPQYCRFYYHVVQRLRQEADLEHQVPQFLAQIDPDSQRRVQAWTAARVLFLKRDVNALFHLNQRRRHVLHHVDACLEKHGFDHVFVEE